MDLKNFDELMNLVPKLDQPLRVVLAGSDGENMLKGLFEAQNRGFAQAVLVGDRARTMAKLEELGLEKEPYTMVGTNPGDSIVHAAIDVIRYGDADILMRGNMLAHDFLAPLMDRNTGLRNGDRIMSHVALASMPEYPKLIALADMAVIIKPDLGRKKAILRNMVEALEALGYEKPKLALLSLVERGTFRMQDTVEAQSLVYEQKRVPFVDAELWGPISYDLIISKEAARLKRYDCPWTGGGFDGILAPELTTANVLLKSWLIHAHSDVCGAVMGAKVPIAMTSRSVSDKESLLSLAFCTILHEYYRNKRK